MNHRVAPNRRQLTAAAHLGLLLGILWASSTVLAQPEPRVLWNRIIGGQAQEEALAVRQTPDGGYLIAGLGNGHGGESGRGAVVKLDSDGQVIWNRMYGDNGHNSRMFALEALPDSGFVVLGVVMTNDNNYEAWLIRANAAGDPIWTRTFGGWMNDQGYAITLTSDGGFAVAGLDATLGSGRYLSYLVRLNGDGEILWQNAYGVPEINVEARSVHQCADGGFIVTGGSVSYGEWNTPFNMFVIRTDSLGEALWARQYGAQGNEFAGDAVCLDDGGFIVVGYTTSRGAGGRDMCMMKLDADGNRVWFRRYGGTEDDAAFSITPTSDGGYVVGGYTASVGRGDEDLCLIKTNSTGQRQWIRTYGTPAREYPWSNQCFQLTADGGYILAGTITPSRDGTSDMFIVKTGPDQLRRQRVQPVKVEAGMCDIWTQEDLADPDNDMAAVVSAQPGAGNYSLGTNYPNPFNPTTLIAYDLKDAGHVTLQVYNLVGQLVTTLVNGNEESGHHTISFDGSRLPSGVYIYSIEANGFRAQNKMLLMK